MRKYFPDATKIYVCVKTLLCNKCTYVQRYINDDIFDPPADYDETFSSSYFLKEPIETMESIVMWLEDINTERIQVGCPDNSPPEDTEVIIGDKKMTRMIELMIKNRQHAQMTLNIKIRR